MRTSDRTRRPVPLVIFGKLAPVLLTLLAAGCSSGGANGAGPGGDDASASAVSDASWGGGAGGSSDSGMGTADSGTTQGPTITGVTLALGVSTVSTLATTTVTPVVTGTGSFANTVNLSVTPSSAGTLSASTSVASGTALTFTPSTTLTGTTDITITAVSTEDSSRSATAVIKAAVSWYVSPKGSDGNDGKTPQTPFATLQYAEGKATAGDIVYAMAGTYTRPNAGAILDISSAGTPTQWITFTAYPGDTPVVQLSTGNWFGIIADVTASFIEISGFTVRGLADTFSLAGAQAADNADAGAYATSGDYNEGCIVAGNNPSTSATHANHINMLRNSVSGCTGGGIGSLFADYITISGNTIADNAWFTIYGGSAISTLSDYPSDTSDEYKMIITNNVLYGNEEFLPWVSAGKITDGEGIIIDSNYNSNYDPTIAYGPYSGRTLIANNVIYNDGSSAIEVFESAHVDVINNSTFNDNLNQATEPGRGEIGLSYLADVNVFNNVFYSSTGGNPLVLSTACATCAIDYNLYYGGSNDWSTFGKDGAHDISLDPLYTNTAKPTLTGANTPVPTDLQNAPTSVDLTLKAGSPALGAGTASLPGAPTRVAPSTDILGHARGASGKYDLGAYSTQ